MGLVVELRSGNYITRLAATAPKRPQWRNGRLCPPADIELLFAALDFFAMCKYNTGIEII
jgi:hypothetical protein